MPGRISTFFLLLVITQGLHSIEEYYGRLWEVLAPARFLCSLVSSNLETGFLVINWGLFVVGLGCWFLSTRRISISVGGLFWFWVLIEAINGIGHPVWAIYAKAYVPGLITAPLLLFLSIYLAWQLWALHARL